VIHFLPRRSNAEKNSVFLLSSTSLRLRECMFFFIPGALQRNCELCSIMMLMRQHKGAFYGSLLCPYWVRRDGANGKLPDEGFLQFLKILKRLQGSLLLIFCPSWSRK